MRVKKTLLKLFKILDIFGINFHFNYKSEEKYRTAIGGIMLLTFIIVALYYIIVNLISLFQRESYSVILYDMRIPGTDIFSLSNYSINIALGLTCDYSDSEVNDINDYFEIQMNYVDFIKYINGTSEKIRRKMEIDKCEKSSLNNNFNESFDRLGLKDYYCIPYNDNKFYYDSLLIQGLDSSPTFTYYEITATLKDNVINSLNSLELNYTDKLFNFLTENQCRMQYYFIDNAIQLDNYSYASNYYLGSYSTQIIPHELKKTNLFFKFVHFISDNGLIFSHKVENYYLSYSKVEDYSEYIGSNRLINKPHAYEQFAKLYLKAADTREEVQRKYQKFYELWANMSSILFISFIILRVTANYINSIYANISFVKDRFFINENNVKNFNNSMKKNKFIFYGLDESSSNKINKHNTAFKGKLKIAKNNSDLQLSINENKALKKDYSIYKNCSINNNNFSVIISKYKENYKKKINKNINLSNSDFFRYFLCPNFIAKKISNELKYFIKLHRIILHLLDINNFIENATLFQMISQLSFSKDENIILNFLSKPPITDYNIIEKSNYYEVKEVSDIINSVNNLKKNELEDNQFNYLLRKAKSKLNILFSS